MKWLAVIGTREATQQMRSDVEERVRLAIRGGWGIVTGGSTGVDTIAMNTAMKYGGAVRVYLPVPLEVYVTNLRDRAKQGKCLAEDAKQTILILHKLKQHDRSAVVEPADTVVLSPEAFYARNELVLCLAECVAAYHLEGNATASKLPAGTLLTVERAHTVGLAVELNRYIK